MKFSNLIRCEVETYLASCNFTKDETDVFLELTKDKSIEEISQKLGYSTATVSRRISAIKKKVMKID